MLGNVPSGWLGLCLPAGLCFAGFTFGVPFFEPVPDTQHQPFEPLVQVMRPRELGSPDSQANKDKQPAGAGGHQHNQPRDEAEAAHTDHERLVQVAHHRVGVHAGFFLL